VPREVSGKRSAEAIKGAELVVVDGGPHGLTTTHVAEFNAALTSFLAR
jgi:non-heme chloroperoxidase